MDKFRSSLKFLFYVLRLCCLNAIDLSNSTPRFKVTKLWIGYAVLASASYGYFHIATAQVDLKTAQGANFVTTLIDYYNKYSGLILFVTCIFVTLARQKSLAEVLALIEDHDVTLDKYFDRKINYAKHGRTPIYYVVFYATAIGYFEYSNCIMYIQDFVTFNDFCILMCIIPLFVSIATLIQFVYYLILIRSRLQLLGDLLKEQKLSPMEQHLNIKFNSRTESNKKKTVIMVQSIEAGMMAATTPPPVGEDGNKKAEKLDMKIIQTLYEKLHTTLVLLNSIFGLQLVVMITVQFITLTTLSYFTCMQVIRLSSRDSSASSDEVQAIIGTGLWIVLFLMKIFTLCYHCQRIKEQGEACGHYVHHYQISKRYSAEKHEIKMFSEQILLQNFVISPGGLFPMDMAMGFSIIGATTTYIIILIQFDISQT